MKKILAVATLGATIIGLSACSTGGDTLVKTDSGTITKEDFFKEVSTNSTVDAQVLENMIEKKILEDNYKVSDKEVEDKLKEVKGQFSSDEEFQAALESNGMKDEQALKDQIKTSLLQIKAVTDGVKVTDKQLKEYYEENKDKFVKAEASHILVADEETAKKVKKELDDGADFAELAKKYSTDTATATNGGQLGEFTKADMVEEFSDVAFTI
ncbi:peptidylprolyl isomerase [Priestia filamentosa]|uniref:peptidylprolyl isomerase n=1 Tax=Priestia filamentosa TaxID=1402861 RepID=UPI003982293E